MSDDELIILSVEDHDGNYDKFETAVPNVAEALGYDHKMMLDHVRRAEDAAQARQMMRELGPKIIFVMCDDHMFDAGNPGQYGKELLNLAHQLAPQATLAWGSSVPIRNMRHLPPGVLPTYFDNILSLAFNKAEKIRAWHTQQPKANEGKNKDIALENGNIALVQGLARAFEKIAPRCDRQAGLSASAVEMAGRSDQKEPLKGVEHTRETGQIQPGL